MADQRQIPELMFKLMNGAHKAILGLSGGHLLSRPYGMPAVELTTTGRTSGLPRTTMLTSPIHDPNRVVVVASKGGNDHHPQWYQNLSVNPDVEVRIEGTTRAMRARTASPEEKAALWPDIVKAYKGYAGYQEKTSRDIPVVICEPRD
jgi:deazaflavin-dependent oxidoreductase (nitroreductase family)